MRRAIAKFIALSSIMMVTAACSSPEAEAPVGAAASDSVQAPAAVRPSAERFERSFVFLSNRQDSVLSAGWMADAASRPDGVDRISRGVVTLAGTGQVFYRATAVTSPSAVPWRLLPDTAMRILVGESDRVEQLIFEKAAPPVAFRLGDLLNEWTTGFGAVMRLLDAEVEVGGRTFTGRLLDVTHSWRESTNPPPGDWMLLTSGDSLALVMHAMGPGSEQYQVWGRQGLQTIGWPEATVTWGAVQAYDRARRDVPVSWSISSDTGDLSALLELRRADLEAGIGDGPLLPVDGFLEVGGRLVLRGAEYAVRGLIRHTQR